MSAQVDRRTIPVLKIRALFPSQAHGMAAAMSGWRGNLVRRIWILISIVLLGISGAAVAADVLVTTDREQLDGFVDAVTQSRLDDRLDGALGFVDPSAVPCRLQQGGDAHEYRDGERGELADAVRSALSVFDSAEQELLQHGVKVDGDRASVTTRMGDAAYEQTVIYDLVREDERWLIKRVRTL